jgi:hypothetical protein
VCVCVCVYKKTRRKREENKIYFTDEHLQENLQEFH